MVLRHGYALIILAVISGALGFAGKNWKVIGLAAVVAFAGVQSWRVGNLKADLSGARAALVNPATGKKWKAEAERDAAALKTCRANVASLDGALTVQNEAVAAWKASGDQMARNAERAASEARKAQGKADALAAKLAGFQAGKTCEEREGNVVDLIEGMDR